MPEAQVCESQSENTSFGWLELFKRPVVHVSLAVFATIIVYSKTFDVPFLFDDSIIFDSQRLGNISAIPSLFWNIRDYFGSRPLLLATISLNYHFGGANTWGYHIVNLALHLTNGYLLYLLIILTGRNLDRDERCVHTTALIASLIFLVHPIQTEAVTNIVNRSILLATAFYFSGIIFFLKAVTSVRRWWLFAAGLSITSILGMASREDFITFPIMLVLYDLFFVSRFSIKEAARHWKTYLPISLGVVYFSYLLLMNTYESGTDFPGIGIPYMDYFLTQFNVHWTYMRLLLLPISQNIDYDYPISNSLFELSTIVSFIGYLGLWAVGIALARKRPVISFTVLWFLVTLIPISFGVTFMDLRLDDVIFEHRLYLPGVAFFILAGSGAASALRRVQGERRLIVLAAVIAVFVVLAGASYKRNAVWTSEMSLWSDAVKKSPQKARPHYNLGNAYSSGGSFSQSLKHYETAIRLRPKFSEAHNNLGNALDALGRSDEAVEHYLAAIKLKPRNAEAYNNLGVALSYLGQSDKAIEQYLIAIRLKPDYADAHYNLGLVHMRKGYFDTAIYEFQTAIKLKPDYAVAYFQLGMTYKAMGYEDQAQTNFRLARELSRIK